ncbi:unnamed protein product [Ambrosiozyma monospora]|uniref:Unnamed protein product n=1 Tax=Ambrosiozyma monospora TaxID=43982 RepID=A0ACB5U6N5_AMBMO|nr:unnamed protein product [Ambrosiozyma monospora]
MTSREDINNSYFGEEYLSHEEEYQNTHGSFDIDRDGFSQDQYDDPDIEMMRVNDHQPAVGSTNINEDTNGILAPQVSTYQNHISNGIDDYNDVNAEYERSVGPKERHSAAAGVLTKDGTTRMCLMTWNEPGKEFSELRTITCGISGCEFGFVVNTPTKAASRLIAEIIEDYVPLMPQSTAIAEAGDFKYVALVTLQILHAFLLSGLDAVRRNVPTAGDGLFFRHRDTKTSKLCI